MEWWLILLILGALLGVFFVIGVPVAFAFMGVNIIGFYLFVGGVESLKLLVPSAFDGIAHFTLVAVPLFIFMGEALFHTGLAKIMIDNLGKWVGHARGSLSLLAIIGGTLFAMISGSAVSGVAVFGATLVPEMRERGYGKPMIFGPVLGAGSLATVIPPSILVVIIATLSQQSVGRLLVAAVVPGLILAFSYFVYILVRARLQPHLAPPYAAEAVSWGERLRALGAILPLSLLILLVLGSIFFGVATPSETAALGATGVLVLAALYGTLSWARVKSAFMATVSVTTMVFMIVMSSTAFGQLLAFTGVARELVDLAVNLPVSPIVIVLAMQILLIIMGMFIEDISILLITIPLFFPIIRSLGLDEVWFGILMLMNMQMAIISPPFGLLLFTLKGVVPDATLGEIYRSSIPILFILLAVLILLIVFPDLVTWLPRISNA
jgi:tripartite ATP-independent transporter DctM subunit